MALYVGANDDSFSESHVPTDDPDEMRNDDGGADDDDRDNHDDSDLESDDAQDADNHVDDDVDDDDENGLDIGNENEDIGEGIDNEEEEDEDEEEEELDEQDDADSHDNEMLGGTIALEAFALLTGVFFEVSRDRCTRLISLCETCSVFDNACVSAIASAKQPQQCRPVRCCLLL